MCVWNLGAGLGALHHNGDKEAEERACSSTRMACTCIWTLERGDAVRRFSIRKVPGHQPPQLVSLASAGTRAALADEHRGAGGGEDGAAPP
jgi:hypothetical protein